MDDDYVETVLALVEQVPAGRVTTYGAVADAVGRGGPRGVGRVMAWHGSAVAWWRVVRADGRPAAGHEEEAAVLLRAEGVPVGTTGRVVLRDVLWWPEGPAVGGR